MFLTPAELLTFVLTTAAVMAMPGVTVSSVVGTTLGHRVRAGFAMEAGAVLARIPMLLLLSLGLEVISQTMSAAFEWVKLAGAAYLVWLGIRMIRKPPRFADPERGSNATRRQVLNGFLVLWGNPKALLFFGAFLPQFVEAAQPIAPQIAALGLIWLAIVVVTDGAYILLAGTARRLFVGAFAQRVGWVSGLVLIGAGVWLAFQQKA